jgi:tetratricopeptide (TPR) repeat protein
MDIPARYFRFLRSGDARPLEPVLEHNRLDLISLAAVCAHAVELVEEGSARCRDAAEALALGKIYERAGCVDKAIAAYQHAEADPSAHLDVVLEAIYRLGLRLRRDRRFAEAADCWRRLLEVPRLRQGFGGQGAAGLRHAFGGQAHSQLLGPLRQYAVEALAIHHEHRERDYEGAKELTLQLLDESDEASILRKSDATRHRLARLEKKIARKNDSHLFGGCA